MNQIARRLTRSLPGGIRPDELAHALVAGLCTPDTPPPNQAEIADRLKNDPGSVGAIVEELLSEPTTARAHLPALLLASMRPAALPEIISLGTHCFTSSLLQRWQVRGWSGPFDWVFASVPMITHCIEDDFTAFLDRSQYRPVPIEQRRDGPTVNRVDHALYRDQFGIEYVFNHHDVHLDEGHAYLARCVDRFRQCLSSPEPKVFVVARTQGEGPLTDLRELRQAIRKHDARFSLAVFEVPPAVPVPRASPRMELVCDEDELQVYEFVPASAWEPLRFADIVDEHVLMRQVLQRASALMSRPDPA